MAKPTVDELLTRCERLERLLGMGRKHAAGYEVAQEVQVAYANKDEQGVFPAVIVAVGADVEVRFHIDGSYCNVLADDVFPSGSKGLEAAKRRLAAILVEKGLTAPTATKPAVAAPTAAASKAKTPAVKAAPTKRAAPKKETPTSKPAKVAAPKKDAAPPSVKLGHVVDGEKVVLITKREVVVGEDRKSLPRVVLRPVGEGQWSTQKASATP